MLLSPPAASTDATAAPQALGWHPSRYPTCGGGICYGAKPDLEHQCGSFEDDNHARAVCCTAVEANSSASLFTLLQYNSFGGCLHSPNTRGLNDVFQVIDAVFRRHGVGCMHDWVESDLILKEKTANIQASVRYLSFKSTVYIFLVLPGLIFCRGNNEGTTSFCAPITYRRLPAFSCGDLADVSSRSPVQGCC